MKKNIVSAILIIASLIAGHEIGVYRANEGCEIGVNKAAEKCKEYVSNLLSNEIAIQRGTTLSIFLSLVKAVEEGSLSNEVIIESLKEAIESDRNTLRKELDKIENTSTREKIEGFLNDASSM